MTKNVKRPPSAQRSTARTRREQILQAGTNLLFEDGYASFPVRGIAARAGLRLSHVQYCFPDPTRIVETLLQRLVDQYAGDVLELFDDRKMPQERRLEKALRFLLGNDEYRTSCVVFMAEITSLAARDRKVARALSQYYRTYLDALSSIVRELNPRLSETEQTRRAAHALALIEGMASTRNYIGSETSRAFDVMQATAALERIVKAP